MSAGNKPGSRSTVLAVWLRPLVDISLSLGFHDQSKFVKAFKRWQGETPGQYRSRNSG